ncbi:hypothetical protein [Halorubrum vacuolatum]|uniref:Uncharacterized protein n=1 Tax=Halorubrum vacuolatum TaxID=63740 RepID=A0A238X524_HALVU|nr:hypothetical protein [Halorubrum vacuolatum]SNR54017.1 hypothetical protein SAMN06264855_11375 [Halorubrum vacuolatum]
MPSATDASTERTFTMIGVGSAVMNLIAFTAVGVIAIENVAYGGIVGILGGVGSYLFIPWFLSLSAAQEGADGDLPLADAATSSPYHTSLGTLGLGLEAGAIVMLAVGFSIGPDFLAGVASALVVALATYFVGSVVLDR